MSDKLSLDQMTEQIELERRNSAIRIREIVGKLDVDSVVDRLDTFEVSRWSRRFKGKYELVVGLGKYFAQIEADDRREFEADDRREFGAILTIYIEERVPPVVYMNSERVDELFAKVHSANALDKEYYHGSNVGGD